MDLSWSGVLVHSLPRLMNKGLVNDHCHLVIVMEGWLSVDHAEHALSFPLVFVTLSSLKSDASLESTSSYFQSTSIICYWTLFFQLHLSSLMNWITKSWLPFLLVIASLQVFNQVFNYFYGCYSIWALHVVGALTHVLRCLPLCACTYIILLSKI